MAFYDRLIGGQLGPSGEPHIPVHQFHAACAEIVRGNLTAAAMATAFGLSPSEQTEAQALVVRVTGGLLSSEEVHQVCLLAEYGIAYTTVASLKTRLGVA